MHVPFLDLKSQYSEIRDEISEAITEVLDSGRYILGPQVEELEQDFAREHESAFGVAVNNGTAALHLALWSLGIKAGDEVILPVNTFVATAEAVTLCGARPVFVDHDDYYNISIDEIESKITRKTRALLPVHLYGQPAQVDAVRAIASRYDLKLIEDAAQAHFARYAGESVGKHADATCFSFYPGKNLGAYGEGGMVITNDEVLGSELRVRRDHGSRQKYEHVVLGHNYRLEALQGAILNVKMRHIKKWTQQRIENALRYDNVLADIPQIAIPLQHPQSKSVYHLYVIQAENREGLQKFLHDRDIETGLHYPRPLHLQPAFAYLGYKQGAFPKAEKSAKRILSLPMYPELEAAQIEHVASTIREFYSK